jgi:hypothetical protein
MDVIVLLDHNCDYCTTRSFIAKSRDMNARSRHQRALVLLKELANRAAIA